MPDFPRAPCETPVTPVVKPLTQTFSHNSSEDPQD